jgi:hypothetical protein
MDCIDLSQGSDQGGSYEQCSEISASITFWNSSREGFSSLLAS